jgi:hypothetical protein
VIWEISRKRETCGVGNNKNPSGLTGVRAMLVVRRWYYWYGRPLEVEV